MKNNNCPFCHPDRDLILDSEHCFAIFDGYPDYFDLEEGEKGALWKMVAEGRSYLEREFHPDGFNVGFNVGREAGQTVDHVHIHVIPRYSGDMDDPTGGVRHVIPEKGKYRPLP